MKLRRRHTSYRGKRRSNRAYRRWLILGLVVFVVIVVLLTVKWGLYLREKALANEDEILNPPPEETVGEGLETDPILSDAPAIAALRELSLAGMTAEQTETDEVLALQDGEALLLCLRGRDGAPAYASPTAAALTLQSEETDLPSLPFLIGTLQGKNPYLSALLCVSAPGDDAVADEAVRAYEAALAREMIAAGTDEILVAGLMTQPADAEAACAFADRIRGAEPGAMLGIVIPYACFLQEDAGVAIRRLAAHYSILVVDCTDLSDVPVTPEDDGRAEPPDDTDKTDDADDTDETDETEETPVVLSPQAQDLTGRMTALERYFARYPALRVALIERDLADPDVRTYMADVDHPPYLAVAEDTLPE